MIPIFEFDFWEVASLGLARPRPDSDSESVAVAEDAGDNCFDVLVCRSGVADNDFCFVVGMGLVFSPPKAASFVFRGFELGSLLRTGAGEELEELERRNAP